VLNSLSKLTVSELGVDYHEEEIEEFEDGQYDMTFYYLAIIIMRANEDQEHD
jgi:hypothetical protein